MDQLSEIITGLVASGLLASFWLLPKYLEKRVTEAARGAVDIAVGKQLADHQQGLAMERERYARDYGLFASKRNEVYAGTFSLLEQARGYYAPHFASLSSHTDFSRSGSQDLVRLADALEFLSETERVSLKELTRSDVTAAGQLANSLKRRNDLRHANRVFGEFRNSLVLNALYFDERVETALDGALEALAKISTLADELIEGETVSYKDRVPVFNDLENATKQVRLLMSAEIRAGFISATALAERTDEEVRLKGS